MKICFIGDVHAKWERLGLKQFEPDATVVQVGDLGMGFRGCTSAAHLPIHHFIRGNHDNPTLCRADAKYLGDYGFQEKLGFFFVSGAWSIDHAHRTEGVDWWRDEQLPYHTMSDALELYEQKKPRVMVTHDCPASLPEQLGWKSIFGEWTPNSTSAALQAMLEVHRPEVWVFGHHHKHTIKDICGTKFICLNELETFTIKNAL
jgi:predicted phosphodiesterase